MTMPMHGLGSASALYSNYKYALVEQVQFFSWLEADSASRSNGDFRTCPRIASDPGFARFDAEDAKSTQLNAVARCEGSLHAEEDGINGGLGLDSR